MKKITTLFLKDPNDLSRVLNVLDELNTWIYESGIPTQKFDGSSCAIIKSELYKRYDLKPNKKLPPNAIPCQAPDIITGHHPHWIKCDRSNNNDKWFFEAFDNLDEIVDGTYELCGEKINKNPEKIIGHKLLKHGSVVLDITDFSYDNIKQYLTNHDIEGIVFHDKNSDKMCKIRKKDFNIKR